MKTIIFLIASAVCFAQGTPGLLGPTSGTGGGTAQAQTVSFPQPWSLAVNQPQVCWTPSVANTAAAPTLTVTANGVALTAKSITKLGTTALVANDIVIGAVACVIYDGTEFQLQNPQTTSAAATPLTGGTDWFWWGDNNGPGLLPADGGANSGKWFPWVTRAATMKNIEYHVDTGAAAGKGLLIGIFAVSSGIPTGSALCYILASGTNVTATGTKSIAFTGGANVSGGVCSIAAGSAVSVAFTSDDTGLTLTGSNTFIADGFGPNATYAHGADVSAGAGNLLSTGTGGSLAFTSTGVWTNYQGFGNTWPILRYAN